MEAGAQEEGRKMGRKFSVNFLVQRVDLSPFYSALGIWTTSNL